MPGATAVYAIPYPCAGENIDCAAFEAWADGIQAALTSVAGLEDDAKNRPNARASGTNQAAFVAATPTNLVYQTENHDNDSMINLGVDATAITTTTAGWYLFAASIEAQVSATVTSVSLALSQNATVIYRSKNGYNAASAEPDSGVQVIGLIQCAAADVIRAVFTWTGAGASPTVTRATLFGYLVSQA